MTRFNPFASVNCQYGAPMGRHGNDAASWDGTSKLYVRHCGGDGYYDRGGAYWGHSRVYAVWTRGGGWCAYVDAATANDAVARVVTACAEGTGRQVRHDWLGFYVCTDEEAEHEDAGNPSVGFDGREHFTNIDDAWRQIARNRP